MEDENKPGENTPAAANDEVKNLKAEMNRKLDNTNAQLAQLLEQIKRGGPAVSLPNQAQPKTKVSVFDNEDAYREDVVGEAERRMEAKLAAQQAQQAKMQSTIQSILRDFPEAGDESSPLMQRAREIHESLPEDERTSPLAMKASVAEAAAEIGLKPKSKRRESPDEGFALGGGSGQAASSGTRSRKDGDISNETKFWAEMLGVDLSDAKTKERIKSKHGRKTYNSYE